MQLASSLVLALLVTDSCRPHPLTFGNWVTNVYFICKKVGRSGYRKQGILSGRPSVQQNSLQQRLVKDQYLSY